MHTTSGLLDELAGGHRRWPRPQAQVLDYVREWVPSRRKAPLGGNTVATDRGFLARDMPELEAYLHYRIIDVSSIKELSRRWYPRVYFNAPKKPAGTARWPTSARASPSCATTARPSSCPQPGPDVGDRQGDARVRGPSSTRRRLERLRRGPHDAPRGAGRRPTRWSTPDAIGVSNGT